MRILKCFVVGLLLSGCASSAGNYFGLNAEQIAEVGKILDAAVACQKAETAWFAIGGISVFASVDKDIKARVEITPECAVIIDTIPSVFNSSAF